VSWIGRHLAYAALADLVEGRLSAAERTAAEQHLAVCERCAADREWLAATIGLMRDDRLVDAPDRAVERAIGIFRPRIAPQQPRLLRRIVAALSFDSGLPQQQAFGVRSGLPSARQLLWSAAPYDVDLRIEARGEALVVAGQVLGPCRGGDVALQGPAAAAASLNEQCEWTLPPVPPGDYTLLLRLGDAEIAIPDLRIEAPDGPR